MTPEQRAERLEQIARDRVDVEQQVASGELDESAAELLRDRYSQEESELANVPVDDAAAGGTRPRVNYRVLAGTALFAVAIVAIVILVANAIEDRAPGEFVTGNIDSRDLSEVSTEEMEDVVAEFPNVTGMRLALARRYFDQGDFSAALPHYLVVLENDPNEPEANANVGWMTFLSDPSQADTAAAFLERSLAAAPGFGQATFYLANVRLYGLDDPAGAEELLIELADTDDLPQDVRDTIEQMLDEAARS